MVAKKSSQPLTSNRRYNDAICIRPTIEKDAACEYARDQPEAVSFPTGAGNLAKSRPPFLSVFTAARFFKDGQRCQHGSGLTSSFFFAAAGLFIQTIIHLARLRHIALVVIRM